jgi:hypothetical protein
MLVFSGRLITFAGKDPVPWILRRGAASLDPPGPIRCEQALGCRARKELVERQWPRR